MNAAPLTDEEFAGLMSPLGPFGRRPSLAVGVSGGPDSLALCLLAARWASRRGGRVVGLTVDHGLRAESAAEAAQVGRWLADRQIPHQVLPWGGPKPATGIQAAAREARYALLRRWCAEAGIIHLLLAHHREDQAETFLLRLARGSGVDGLAAIASLVAWPSLLLLRPLLAVPRARLAATLCAVQQPWIEDPSNSSDRFKRVRLRKLLPQLAGEGLDAQRLAGTARRLGRAAQALDQATAALMVRVLRLAPAGFAWLDAQQLAEAPAEIGLRLLAAVCRTIGGGRYPPRLERLERLHATLCEGLPARRTFAGCVLAPNPEGVLVCREAAAVEPPRAVAPGDEVLWDGRFRLRLKGQGRGEVAALGAVGAGESASRLVELARSRGIPKPVLATLPAIRDEFGLSAVPHLGYVREMPTGPRVERILFAPASALLGAGHCLV